MTLSPTILSLRDRLRSDHTASDVLHLHWAADVPLRLGVTHEWFDNSSDRREWAAPIGILADLAARGVQNRLLNRVVWIGAHVFPFPTFLDRRVLGVSIFIDPPHHDARLWAIDLALRCTSPTCVIADGQGLNIAASRRLQLAAACGRGLCLLARPGFEHGTLSAATSRWRVEPTFTGHPDRVAWKLTLLRNKDQPTLAAEQRAWTLESSDAQGLVAVPPLVARGTDRSASLPVAS